MNINNHLLRVLRGHVARFKERLGKRVLGQVGTSVCGATGRFEGESPRRLQRSARIGQMSQHSSPHRSCLWHAGTGTRSPRGPCRVENRRSQERTEPAVGAVMSTNEKVWRKQISRVITVVSRLSYKAAMRSEVALMVSLPTPWIMDAVTRNAEPGHEQCGCG